MTIIGLILMVLGAWVAFYRGAATALNEDAEKRGEPPPALELQHRARGMQWVLLVAGAAFILVEKYLP